ncbi:MAG: hypothetical protein MZU91_09030 [Desulfosudis oleivorans]|nr:hypothetical protein [Desulfosudis oleivorans]
MKEIGFFGTDDWVHGSRRRQGRWHSKRGRVIAESLTADRGTGVSARKIITFCREEGVFPERQGATIGRVGFDTVVKAVK